MQSTAMKALAAMPVATTAKAMLRQPRRMGGIWSWPLAEEYYELALTFHRFTPELS
jgi:hypothetical protein